MRRRYLKYKWQEGPWLWLGQWLGLVDVCVVLWNDDIHDAEADSISRLKRRQSTGLGHVGECDSSEMLLARLRMAWRSAMIRLRSSRRISRSLIRASYSNSDVLFNVDDDRDADTSVDSESLSRSSLPCATILDSAASINSINQFNQSIQSINQSINKLSLINWLQRLSIQPIHQIPLFNESNQFGLFISQ